MLPKIYKSGLPQDLRVTKSKMQVKNVNVPLQQNENLSAKVEAKSPSGTLSRQKNAVQANEVSNGGDSLYNVVYKPVTPPYRMPPQPPGGSATLYGDAPIPGAAPLESSSSSSPHPLGNNILRTHSSKFPIERELILTSDKASTKIPLMNDRTGLHFLPRTTSAIAPDHPKQLHQAWNQQNQVTQAQQHADPTQTNLTGAIPRTPARLPEDVTSLAERENNKDRDTKESKNAVSKTYHTIKDLISSRFKKDSNENADELNNVVVQQQNQQQAAEQEELRSPYSALPVHMRQMQALNQSQPNIWNAGKVGMTASSNTLANQQAFVPDQNRSIQQRTASQPQLNMPFERRGSQSLLDTNDRRGSLANIDVTDSDDGGFATRGYRPQTMYQVSFQQTQEQTQPPLQLHTQPSQRNSPQVFQNNQNQNAQMSNINSSNPYLNGYQQQQIQTTNLQHYTSPYMHAPTPQAIQNHQAHVQQQINLANQAHAMQVRQDVLRSSFQKQQELQLQQQQQQQQSHHQQQIQQQQQHQTQQQQQQTHQQQQHQHQHQQQQQQQQHQKSMSSEQLNTPEVEPPPQPPKIMPRTDLKLKQMPSSAASSDYDKSGNHSSNVDSGRGSAAYSSGRKGTALDTSPESSDSHVRPKENDSEWVDIVDAELRHILEPSMQGLNIRPESTVSGSVSSMTPPLPPLSPDGPPRTKASNSKDVSKLEYGMDSYNRASRSTGPIGPSRAGWPGSSLQKHSASRSAGKKQDQTMLKRHLFGLDNDQTSTTTRSLDLESLLGGPFGGGQSVSDSETDTQGLRHIRSQLEGLEHMYSEVLRMLGSRAPNGAPNEPPPRHRRRHGSLSSLPSSSVSSRPIRDRRRADDRRKVRDMKGINKRFQRLESHVVTLARSVAHLSSEMRSQHLVTQELERLRDDLTTLRSQALRSQNIFGASGADPEPPNLTNPRRVKKLTKFFGEDPPLMRLFLKKLGYEKYASLFEAERVGMVELPYLGEERLQKLGVPLGPRLRILQEAQISLCKDTTLCIV